MTTANCGGQIGSPSGVEDESSSNDITLSWDFTSATDYTFSDNEIEFTGSAAQVKTVPLNYTNSTIFNSGTMSELEHSSGVLKISSGAETQLSSDWTPHWPYLTGYWRADINWDDTSVYSSDGTVSGGVIIDTADKQVGDGSGYFDGIDDVVTVSDNDGLDLAIQNSMTFSFWVKLNSSDDTELTRLVSKACSNGGFTDTSYTITKSTTNEIGFYATSDGTTFSGSAISSPVRSEIWNHVLVTYDGTSIKLFINGVLEVTTAFAGPIYNGTNELVFGARSDGVGCTSQAQHSNVHLDEIAIWSKVYTDDEVSYLYNRQKQKYSGHYDSPVIDTGNNSGYVWDELSWVSSLPFGKQMPGDVTADGTPDSESSTDYSALVGSTGNTSADDFMLELLLYYRFNGSADYDGTVGEVVDHSGLTNHGAAVGGNIVSGNGQFYESRYFDGTGKEILATGISFAPTFASPRSAGFWVKLDPVQPDVGATTNILYTEGDGTRYDQVGFYNQTHGVPADIGKLFYTRTDGTTTVTKVSSTKINDGKYHHVVTQMDGGDIKIFIDGEISGSAVTDTTAGSYSGTYEVTLNSSTDSFSGDMDEFAIWKRSLHNLEVLQAYRRGANRVKYLVKSCVDSSCNCESFNVAPAGNFNDCDGDSTPNNLDPTDAYLAKWKGVTNDGQTAFSELHNSSLIDASGVATGDVGLVSPSLSFSNFSAAGLSITNNRYFQFRVLMESDDDSANCGASVCVPEVTSISLGGVKKFALETSITNVTVFNYNVGFKDFSVVENGDINCSFGYQLSSNNGSTYYYYNGGNWMAVTGANEKNIASEVSAGIVRFGEQFPTGSFKFKVFMTSLDGLTNCSIDQLSIIF